MRYDDSTASVSDDDGNGKVDPYDIGDGVMAQGRYMCAIAATIDGWIADAPEKIELWGGEPFLYWAKIKRLIPALAARFP